MRATTAERQAIQLAGSPQVNMKSLLATMAPLLLVLASSASPLAAQDPEVVTSDEAVLTVERTPLETLKHAVQSDVEERYRLLNMVSPRGLGEVERAEMVKLLVGELDSQYPDIRAQAARVLGLFEADAASAVPALMKLLSDKEPTVTLEPVWIFASKSLATIGAEHVLQPLVEAIPDSDRTTYYGIAATISELGEAAKPAAAIFVELLRNGPENRRWAAMYTLSKLGDAALPAIPDYIENLHHKEFNFQVIACRALAALGAASKDAVPKLIELMDKDVILSTRTHAAMCLGAIGPIEGVDLADLFTDMIEEPNAFSQERGLIALGRLGRHAEGKREFVEGLLNQETFSQRPEAARTLWQITGDREPTLGILMELVDDPTYDTRVQGVLREMGPDAAPIAPALVERLNTNDQSLRQVWVEVLVGMGPAAKEHVDAIRACLDDAEPDTAFLIDKAIEKIESR